MAVEQVKLEIKLDEIFGQNVPDDSVLREAIAQEAIDIIVNRTKEGKDVKGKNFTPIPRDSPYYKIKKGITGNGKADLFLFGDMLSSIETIDESSQSITIGFPDELQNAKAFNHNTGDTLPKREFFGLSKKDKEQIASKFEGEVTAGGTLTPKQLAKENRLLAALRLLNDLDNEITFNMLLDKALKRSSK